MSARVAAWLGWTGWVLTVTCVGLMVLFMVLAASAGVPVAVARPIDLGFSVALLAYATVGVAVVTRRPRNALGWLFCGVGLAMGVAGFARPYAIYALLVAPAMLPAGEVLAWVHSVGGVLAAGAAAVFVLLLFPHGHLPSRRWRPVAWLSAAGIVLLVTGVGLQPGPFEIGDLTFVRNPLGIEGTRLLFRSVERLGLVLLVLGVLASVASMILRLRTSRGTERQQLKWVAYAAALVGLTVLVAAVIYFLSGARVATNLGGALAGTALAGVPVAAGVAILRYHLYEIDVLIRRTLVYGVLTSGLGGVYWGSVVLLQPVLRAFTDGSHLAIIVSTLAVAALFHPVRRSVQDLVDRRFNRRAYDAKQALRAFSVRLRQDAELDSVTDEMLAIVAQTMQPARASVWLGPDGHGRIEQPRGLADMLVPPA